jgi:hypothetical protein
MARCLFTRLLGRKISTPKKLPPSRKNKSVEKASKVVEKTHASRSHTRRHQPPTSHHASPLTNPRPEAAGLDSTRQWHNYKVIPADRHSRVTALSTIDRSKQTPGTNKPLTQIMSGITDIGTQPTSNRVGAVRDTGFPEPFSESVPYPRSTPVRA